MSLLQEVLKRVEENAVSGTTAAHGIGITPSSLFGGSTSAKKPKKSKNVPIMFKPVKASNRLHLRNILQRVVTEDETFNSADVVSKLVSAEKKAKSIRDTVPFGLEDEEGNIVKVYVKADQADDFENALASMLAGREDRGIGGDEKEKVTGPEIAEVLYDLRSRFDIVDVQWPAIVGDEEEEEKKPGMEADRQQEGGEGEGEDLFPEAGGEGEGKEAEGEGGEGGEGEPAPEEGGEGGEGEDLFPEAGGEGGLGGEAEVKSLLQQFVDAMKADAEAKMADAKAREAEARAKEAEAVASASASKVKQEEQVLDMESYYKDKKSKDDEAKKLAKMAKWQHDKAQEYETTISGEEEEEQVRQQRTAKELANSIVRLLNTAQQAD